MSTLREANAQIGFSRIYIAGRASLQAARAGGGGRGGERGGGCWGGGWGEGRCRLLLMSTHVHIHVHTHTDLQNGVMIIEAQRGAG